ncbi:MAG: FAD-dependent oxidoreductase [Planctomycetota bacterium]|jgi:NAD(P)H-nitrite reductase large subunit|nr:FAD-dependent oxidoreductase [Planctomycetota bacterium]
MKYVVIGASAAGINAAGLLRRFDPEGEITVVARDDKVYSRCMLHLKLAGERDAAGLSFVDADFFAANRVVFRGGENVTGILAGDKAVRLESGESIPYDRLLIASGASSFIPPVPGLREAKNVVSLRNMEDVEKLEAWGRPGSRAVIIGAGLVGMDAAAGLIEKGVKATLVEMLDRILAIQLDDYAASRYAGLLRDHGAEVIVGAKVGAGRVGPDGALASLELADGRALPCDFCVVAAGVAPNIGFIGDERIQLTRNKRALAVDRTCRTSRPDVFAAGDVTFLAPIWPEAVRQAEVAAANMCGREASLPDQDWAWTNSMNFFGLPTISYGQTSVADPSFALETYIDGDVYKKVIHKDGVIHGAIFQGDIDNCGVYLRLVRDRIPFAGAGKHPLKLNYADFFRQAANGEFV